MNLARNRFLACTFGAIRVRRMCGSGPKNQLFFLGLLFSGVPIVSNLFVVFI